MTAKQQGRISNQFLSLIGGSAVVIGGLAIFFTGHTLYPSAPLPIIVIFTFGVSVFPSALVLLLYEVFFRQLTSSRLLTELMQEIRGNISPLAELGQSGIKMVYPNRAGLPERLGTLLRGPAVKVVRFCGVQTSTCMAIPDFESIVEAGLRDQCVFQFLFMDRDTVQFDFHAQRERDEFADPSREGRRLRQGAQDTIKYMLSLADKFPGGKENLQLREYFAFPYFSMFQVDRRILVGSYLYSVPCSGMPVFEIEDTGKEGCVFRKYERHFERLFDTARPITSLPQRTTGARDEER